MPGFFIRCDTTGGVVGGGVVVVKGVAGGGASSWSANRKRFVFSLICSSIYVSYTNTKCKVITCPALDVMADCLTPLLGKLQKVS